MNDLKIVVSLESPLWKEGYGSIDKLGGGICAMFAGYESETLKRAWRSLFKRYNQVLRVRGGDDFDVEHTGITRRQKRSDLAITENIDRGFQCCT